MAASAAWSSSGEIGRHAPSFAAALRVALRQDPDVILLGELARQRDHPPGADGCGDRAPGDGHAAYPRAAQAVERLVDVFPAQEKEQVRGQLAGSLCAVLAQKLLPDISGGRVALFELLVNTPAVANLIREGKTHQLPGVMQTGQQSGMQTFTQSFQQRVSSGRL
nr:twitching motility protein PilT [Raoultella sp. NCTC 9187]